MNPNAWPFTYDDIREDFLDQGRTLERCLEFYFHGRGAALLRQAADALQSLQFSRVLFIGNAFSHFASLISKFIFLGAPQPSSFSWNCVELTEFFDYMLPQESEDYLYIFISKSGDSRLLRSIYDHMRLTKIPVERLWLITDQRKSPAALSSHLVFPTRVKYELAIGTKSYLNMILIIYFLCQLLLKKNPTDPDEYAKIHALVRDIQAYGDNWETNTQKIMDFLAEFEFLYLIARDPASLSTACVGALHAKTFTQIFAEGIYISHFFHGPFQILERKTRNQLIRMILIVGESSTDKQLVTRLIDLINSRAGRIILLSNDPSLNAQAEENPRVLLIPFHSDIVALSPIFEFYILQWILLKIAEKRHFLKE